MDLVRRLTRWVGMPTWSRDPAGVERFLWELEPLFAKLGAETELVSLPAWHTRDEAGEPVTFVPAPALWVTRRPEAPCRVLLVTHADTALPPSAPSPPDSRRSDRLWGVGALDDKGGILVLWEALRRCEADSGTSPEIGWSVWIAPDEELGSPCSGPELQRRAAGHDLALVFEPSHPDGALVSDRDGSGNYIAVVRGRRAHAGRNPERGRNAVHALAALVVELDELGRAEPELRINVGEIRGGEAVNVIPDRAVARWNVRARTPEAAARFEKALAAVHARVAARFGVTIEIEGRFGRPPRRLDARALAVYRALVACAADLGRELTWRPSGGVSDANLLTALGLPCADGLGPRGDGMHTAEEWVAVESLEERAALVHAFLCRLEAGVPWNSG
ncbi:hydrolase [Deferrisoma palaeochoriense]